LEFVEGLMDKGAGDVVLDYRKGNERLVEDMRGALPEGKKLMYALDAVSGKGSYGNIFKVLSTEGGKLAMVLPPASPSEVPEGIMAKQGQVGVAFNAEKELGFAWSRLFGLGLEDGWLKAVSSSCPVEGCCVLLLTFGLLAPS
jgi:NADPH2:quinone reductase